MLVEQVVNGLVLGSMYALIALGYTLVFGVLDKLNFAHGDLFMFGGFVAVATTALGAPWWAGLVTAFVVAGLLGLLVELVSFRKFKSHDAQITAALSSFGVALVIIDLTQKYWGTEPVALPMPGWVRGAALEFGALRIAMINIAILAATAVLLVALYFLVTRSSRRPQHPRGRRFGLAAELLGIDVKRVTQQTFFLASALAGLAGVMLACAPDSSPPSSASPSASRPWR